MPFVMHQEGRRYLLECSFSEEDSPPANFYVGLCNEVLADGADLDDISTEEDGTGYARQAIASNNTDCVIGTSGEYEQVTFAEVEFTAGAGGWGALSRYFVATTINGTGVLLFSDDLLGASGGVAEGLSVFVQARLRIRREP